MGAAARGRRFVKPILPAALMAVMALLPGCPSGPPEGAAPSGSAGDTAAQTSTSAPQATAPADAPVLRAGTYELAEEAFAKPWWREVVGYLSRSGEGVWEGSLRLDRGTRARLRVGGTGSGSTAELTLDANRDRRLDETPAKSRPSAQGPRLKDKPTRRFVFPSVSLGDGTQVALGAETSEANPRAVRVFALLDRCLTATVPTDGQAQKVRLLAGDEAELWLDMDAGDTPAPWELVGTDGLVGLGNRLYEVRVDASTPPSLTLADFSGEQATVVFDAGDGTGKQRGVYAPRVAGRRAAQYVGLVAKANFPAGDANIAYLLPNDDQGACLAYGQRTVRLKSGETQTITAGGPVSIDLDVASSSETVDVSLALVTAAGDSVSDWVGEEEQRGKVQLIGPDGAVLDTGEAGFG